MLMACLALGITSCEDRLDIPKHGNMGSKETFYQTDEEAERINLRNRPQHGAECVCQSLQYHL